MKNENILILKIRKSKSVGGGSIDNRLREDQQSMQRQSAQLILGGIDDHLRGDCLREDQQSTFTFAYKGDHLC